MTPVTQSRTGERGTCFRACIASILDLPERAVADFDGPRRYYPDEQGLDDYWANVEGWLAERGLRYRRAPVDGAKPVGWSTIEGVSPRGGLHACVAYNGELAHDPHPQDGTGRGLVEPRWYGVLELGRATDVDSVVDRIAALKPGQHVKIDGVYVYHKGKGAYPYRIATTINPDGGYQDAATPNSAAAKLRTIVWRHYAKRNVTDRTDMLALRRNAEKQGGPFFIQETTKGGAERVLPVRELSKAADASPARVALLLAALLSWYRARKAEGRCDNYDLTRYVPKRRAFDALPLNRYPMSRLLDALGIDIKEYMRRDEAQKTALLRTAIEKLDKGE